MAPIITNTRTTVITIYIVFTKHLLLNNLSAATWSVDLVAVDLTVGPDVHYDEDSGGDEKDLRTRPQAMSQMAGKTVPMLLMNLLMEGILS